MYFEAGKKIATRAIEENLTPDFVRMLLNLHLRGDWGDISEKDRKSNEQALQNGGRIFSGYFTGYGKIYIITDEDRRSTRILFADEYSHMNDA